MLRPSRFTRRAHWLVLLTMLTALLVTSRPLTALAWQDDGEPAADTTAAPAESAPAASTDPPAEEETSSPVQESFLEWMLRASGIFGLILLLLSFLMVAIIMMNVLQVRRDNLLPQDFLETFDAQLQEKDYQTAYDTARSDDSFVARVLAAGLSKLNQGYSAAIEGMQEVGEEESMAMDHKLSYLALIGTVAPMIGLMGTVYGMIDSFSKIAQSTVAPKPKELADGISTALFTTLEGLAVAIPAMVAYSILKNRMSRYVLEVGVISENLMSRFSGKAQAPKGGAAPTAAPAKPAE